VSSRRDRAPDAARGADRDRDGDGDGDGGGGSDGRPEPAARAPHRPSRRQEVIDAAIRVFGAEGVINTTIADIAEACGVVPASVYYHFESKEAVLGAAMEQIAEEIVAVQLPAASQDPRDLVPRVQATFHWSQENPDKARLFYLWSVGITPEMEQIRRRLVEGRIAGAIRYQPVRSRRRQEELNRLLAARTAVEVAMATAVAWLSGDLFPSSTSADEVARALSDVMVRLLGP